VDDPRGREGITALAALVMAAGGTEQLSSAELLKTLFPMAADLDVQVDKEMTAALLDLARCPCGHTSDVAEAKKAQVRVVT
jgi:hypothetical protein